MKAKDLKLRVVNEIEEGIFEVKEFKPYMNYESFVGCILADAEILSPTGLKDKNGIDIYEGDIIIPRYNGFSAFEVKFEKGKFNVSDFKTDSCEVIGDIYQNKYLLE
jgi:uncharacterized phage protein (TIGR01671 family)